MQAEKFGLDSDPWLHNLQSSSLWTADAIVVSKLIMTPPPLRRSLLPLLSPPLIGLEINKPPPPRGLNRGFTVMIF